MDPNSNQMGQSGASPGQGPTGGAPDWQDGGSDQERHASVPDWQRGIVPGAPGDAQQQAAGQQSPGMPAQQPGVYPAQPQGMGGDMGAGAQSVPPSPVPMGGDMSGMAMGTAPKKRFSLKSLPFGVLMIIAVVLLVVMAIASYFFFFKTPKQSASNAAANSSKTASSNATNMATLTSVKLNPPTDMSAFGADTPVANVHVYLTTGSTSDDACSFEFGTLTAAQLPGADIDSIVNPQVTQLKNAGATVDGPTAATALILKDASSSKTYSMPTLKYTFSEGNKHATSYYSLVILKGGDRAIVSRQCANANGAVDQSKVDTVETAAKQVTATPQ
jgi:hypothetical protein